MDAKNHLSTMARMKAAGCLSGAEMKELEEVLTVKCIGKNPQKENGVENDWEMQAARLKDYLVALKAVLDAAFADGGGDALEAANTLCDLALTNVRQQLAEFDQACAERRDRRQA